MEKKANIQYFTLTDEMRKPEKLDWFRENQLKDIPFETIHPARVACFGGNASHPKPPPQVRFRK